MAATYADHNHWSVFLRGLLNKFTKYETSRGVEFKSPAIGLCNRLVQLIVLSYIVGIVFVADKGYQEFDTGESSVVAKVKGNQAHINKDAAAADMFNVEGGVTWDATDVVIPPLENNALFIMTKVSMTPKQVQGKCPEEFQINVNETKCYKDDDCKIGTTVHFGHGFHSGSCVASTGTCEVHAWCPLEDDKRRSIVLSGGENLTILVKNFVMFPRMRIRRRNLGELPERYVKHCTYDPVSDPLCPIFVLKDIARLAGGDFLSMATHGAVVSFAIHWDCNLDFHIRHCMPTYSFRRLDDPKETNSPGWSFRISGYWLDNDEQARYLLKATGIRIVFNVYAVAGRFSIVKFTMNLGSGLGLLGMATLLCDYILFNCARPEVRRERERLAVVDVGTTPILRRDSRLPR
ncbi:P2X purinoceptor 4-like [Paramacrobiotus metropolitanus]|uniref:P2X purinoceptor 4-like n=1 Tax=Paramacrobiotus metropolitanus TaxID=2943436 RepID=UPI002445C9D1|nr:P2X purinoceptor 4-like [Paramacrobiotus metropolitanus]